MSQPDNDQRIAWARANINALLQQRVGIDRRINEFRAFIAMLEESDRALHGRNGSGQQSSLADMVADILTEARGRGMTPAEVTNEVERRGFKPTGKVRLRDLVGIELPRQVRGKRGVVRVSPGVYAIPFGEPEAVEGGE